jgi:hypothetical protein
MPQGKCAFCGTFVTGGGTSLGKHSVACPNCKKLAEKWLERNKAAVAVAEGDEQPAETEAGGQPEKPEKPDKPEKKADDAG